MLFNAVFGFIIVSIFNWQIALFAFISGVVYLLAAHLIKNKLSQVEQARVNALQHSTLLMQEVMEGFSTLKYYTMEKHFQEKLDQAQNDYLEASQRYAKIQTLSVALSSFGYAFAYVGSLAYTLYLVAEGQWLLSDAMFIWPTAMQMSYAVQKIGGLILEHQAPNVSYKRMDSAFQENIEELYRHNQDHLIESVDQDSDETIELEFRNISFSYPNASGEGSTEVLHNINLHIKSGERVAIQGGSGSGKSTLFKLLLGFYQPTSGQILWRNKDINQLDLSERRQLFVYLPQFPQLFDGSVGENLRFIASHQPDEILLSAAERAQIHRFEGRSEDFLDTELGFAGQKLSGGERQRLGLARAYLKNAPIMLLDEMTSALDASLEDKVMESLTEDRGPTLIYITHRAQSASWADRVLYLENGEIIEPIESIKSM